MAGRTKTHSLTWRLRLYYTHTIIKYLQRKFYIEKGKKYYTFISLQEVSPFLNFDQRDQR